METIRKWLNEGSFDWGTGRIVYRPTEEDSSPGWGTQKQGEFIEPEHPILDKEFYAGYGGPECPCFIAEDNEAFYFPEQYDGSTSLCVVLKDLRRYISEVETPYPGG